MYHTYSVLKKTHAFLVIVHVIRIRKNYATCYVKLDHAFH